MAFVERHGPRDDGHASDAASLLVVSDGNVPLRPDLLAQTALQAVTFPRGRTNGWALGDDGTIIATSNGGKNWRLQATGIKKQLTAISMLSDGKRGWVLARDRTVLATVDGGETWTLMASSKPATRFCAATINASVGKLAVRRCARS